MTYLATLTRKELEGFDPSKEYSFEYAARLRAKNRPTTEKKTESLADRYFKLFPRHTNLSDYTKYIHKSETETMWTSFSQKLTPDQHQLLLKYFNQLEPYVLKTFFERDFSPIWRTNKNPSSTYDRLIQLSKPCGYTPPAKIEAPIKPIVKPKEKQPPIIFTLLHDQFPDYYPNEKIAWKAFYQKLSPAQEKLLLDSIKRSGTDNTSTVVHFEFMDMWTGSTYTVADTVESLVARLNQYLQQTSPEPSDSKTPIKLSKSQFEKKEKRKFAGVFIMLKNHFSTSYQQSEWEVFYTHLSPEQEKSLIDLISVAGLTPASNCIRDNFFSLWLQTEQSVLFTLMLLNELISGSVELLGTTEPAPVTSDTKRTAKKIDPTTHPLFQYRESISNDTIRANWESFCHDFSPTLHQILNIFISLLDKKSQSVLLNHEFPKMWKNNNKVHKAIFRKLYTFAKKSKISPSLVKPSKGHSTPRSLLNCTNSIDTDEKKMQWISFCQQLPTNIQKQLGDLIEPIFDQKLFKLYLDTLFEWNTEKTTDLKGILDTLLAAILLASLQKAGSKFGKENLTFPQLKEAFFFSSEKDMWETFYRQLKPVEKTKLLNQFKNAGWGFTYTILASKFSDHWQTSKHTVKTTLENIEIEALANVKVVHPPKATSDTKLMTTKISPTTHPLFQYNELISDPEAQASWNSFCKGLSPTAHQILHTFMVMQNKKRQSELLNSEFPGMWKKNNQVHRATFFELGPLIQNSTIDLSSVKPLKEHLLPKPLLKCKDSILEYKTKMEWISFCQHLPPYIQKHLSNLIEPMLDQEGLKLYLNTNFEWKAKKKADLQETLSGLLAAAIPAYLQQSISTIDKKNLTFPQLEEIFLFTSEKTAWKAFYTALMGTDPTKLLNLFHNQGWDSTHAMLSINFFKYWQDSGYDAEKTLEKIEIGLIEMMPTELNTTIPPPLEYAELSYTAPTIEIKEADDHSASLEKLLVYNAAINDPATQTEWTAFCKKLDPFYQTELIKSMNFAGYDKVSNILNNIFLAIWNANEKSTFYTRSQLDVMFRTVD